MKAHFIIGLVFTLCTALGLFAQEPIDRSGVASAVAEARELMEKGQLEEAAYFGAIRTGISEIIGH